MKPNTQAILEDCIERGIMSALINKDAEWDDGHLANDIQRRIWCEIDLYFDFDN